MSRAITQRPLSLLALALAGALALAMPTLTASAHVPCGKHKPRHTNCGRHLGQLKHGRGLTGPTGPTGPSGATGSTGTTGATAPANNGRGKGRGDSKEDGPGHSTPSSARTARTTKHVPCGRTKPRHTNCGRHKGASRGNKKGHSK